VVQRDTLIEGLHGISLRDASLSTIFQFGVASDLYSNHHGALQSGALFAGGVCHGVYKFTGGVGRTFKIAPGMKKRAVR
jgi:hypothetical protein